MVSGNGGSFAPVRRQARRSAVASQTVAPSERWIQIRIDVYSLCLTSAWPCSHAVVNSDSTSRTVAQCNAIVTASKGGRRGRTESPGILNGLNNEPAMLSLLACPKGHDREAGGLIPAPNRVPRGVSSHRDKMKLSAGELAQNISKYSRCSQSDTSAWKRSISAFLMRT